MSVAPTLRKIGFDDALARGDEALYWALHDRHERARLDAIARQALDQPPAPDDPAPWYDTLARAPLGAAALSEMAFQADADPANHPNVGRAIRRRWRAACGAYRSGLLHANDRSPNRPLRIGYVSGDFRYHSVAGVFAPMILKRDRESFGVYLYSALPTELPHSLTGEMKPTADDVTAEFKAAADGWREVAHLSDDQLAALIRADGIDILVDLSGHTKFNRLSVFCRRPAPVLLSGWGNLNGTGAPEIGLLADETVIPPDERAMLPERVIDLPCAMMYAVPPILRPLPYLGATPGRDFTFGVFNKFSNAGPQAMRAWAEIVTRVPDSLFLIKETRFAGEADRNLAAYRLQEAGMPLDRVRFLGPTPYVVHVTAYHDVDLALDAWPGGGGVSTLEALWMGVPVVTRLGDRVNGRVGSSIMKAIGLADFVGLTDQDYVETAIARANERDRLRAMRSTLRKQLMASPVGGPAGPRAVEAAYRAEWRRWCEAA